jgi:hypothetical protein
MLWLKNFDYLYLRKISRFFLINMCKISVEFVKNESYHVFMNICKPNLAYLTSIFEKIGSK